MCYPPKQTPDPFICSRCTHCNGGSHLPENPPGPPHASPTVLAQTRQHLKQNVWIFFYYSALTFISSPLFPRNNPVNETCEDTQNVDGGSDGAE